MNKDLYFEYIEDFADYIVERVESDEDLFVSVVGKFEEVKNIIKEMFCIAEVDFESLNIESAIMNNYEDEYVLDCWCDDGVVQIGCEPAKKDGEYLNLTGDETYLLDNVSSKIIPLCEGSDLYFVNIEDECDCDEECVERCPCDCHCGDTELCSTDAKSHYSINGKSVSKEEFDKKYKELHEKYEKNMRSILDDYCSFMDEFNTLFSRLW